MLGKHVKQSSLNYPVPSVIIPRYILDIYLDLDIYLYVCLDESIAHTRSLRDQNALLISFSKPHYAIGSQTLAKWIKTVLNSSTIAMPHLQQFLMLFL